jgi:hypothetical protein
MDGYGAPSPHKEFSLGQYFLMQGWGSVPGRAAKLPEGLGYRAGMGTCEQAYDGKTSER